MPSAAAHDPALLDRLLGTARDPHEEELRRRALELAAAVQRVPLPPARLSGWTSLCSAEYGEAVERLQRIVALAASALAVVGRAS